MPDITVDLPQKSYQIAIANRLQEKYNNGVFVIQKWLRCLNMT